MPIPKAPPIQPKNETLQLRVSQHLKFRLLCYADFLHASASYVVGEAPERLFRKDTEFQEYLATHKPPQAGDPVPVIRQLAEILNAYRVSMGTPSTGVMFHSGDGKPMDLDKLAQQVIRRLVKSIGMGWYGWHGFRRGIASNLHELGANEKVVQRILRHAKSHVTKDRYIKAFDPAVLAAMRKLETSLDAISESAPRVHQIQ